MVVTFTPVASVARSALFLCDCNGLWCYLDPGWRDLTGLDADQALGLGWLNYTHPLDREQSAQCWQAGILSQQRFTICYRLASAEGRFIEVGQTASPTPDGWMGILAVRSQPEESSEPSLLDLMFAQSMDGLFLMMLDQPLEWHQGIDKEAALDWAFEHHRMVRINAAMAAQYGSAPAEFLGLTPADLFAHDLEYGRQIWREFFDQGQLQIETQETKRDGTPMTVEGNYACIYDVQGRILGHFGTQREITAQKAHAAELERQHYMNQKILEATPNGVYVYDLVENKNAYMNACVSQVLGYSSEAIVQYGNALLVDNVHPEDWPRVSKHLECCSRMADDQVVEVEYRFRRADGSWCWLQSREVVFGRSKEGRVSQILGVLTDITERKEVEMKLERSQQQFQSLTENSPDIIERFDLHLKHLYISPTLSNLLGIETESFLGKTCQELGLDPIMVHNFESAAGHVITTGKAQRIEFSTPTPKGIREFEMIVAPEYDNDGIIESILGLSRDITDYKNATTALAASERRLQALIAHLPGALFHCQNDRDYTEIYVSDGVSDVTGYSVDDFMSGRIHLGQVIDPEDQERTWNEVQLCLQSRTNYELKYRIRTQSGATRWILDRGHGVYNRNGELLYLECFLTDITTLKEAEIALHNQVLREQAFNRITRTIRDSLDIDTIFLTATQEIGILLQVSSCVIVRYDLENRVWRHLCRYNVDPTSQIDPDTIIPDIDNPVADQLKQQQFVQLKTSDITDPVNQDLTHDRLGTWLLMPIVVEGSTWGSLSLYVADESYNWPEETIRLTQSITDQLAIAIQQAELHDQLQQINQSLADQVRIQTVGLEQALDSEALLYHITEQVRSSLDEEVILQTVVDALGEGLELIFCNVCMYFEDLPTPRYTYKKNGIPLPDLILPVEDYAPIYDTLKQGIPCYFSTELRFERVTLFVAPIRDQFNILGDILVMRRSDQTFNPMEIRLVEQVANQCAIALRQSRLFMTAQSQVKELSRLNALKDDFLSTVSHELRSPMANIKMATRMLSVNLERIQAPEHILRYMKILQDEGDREINLINDLLDLARLESGSADLSWRFVILQDLVEQLIQPLQSRLREQSQTLICDVPPDLPPFKTEVSYLERILSELLHNACKYTPSGEQIQIQIQHTQSLRIQITNTGVEIPPEEQARIFDKFYRVPNNDPWKHGGTGLGLALVKRMVTTLGGEISVHCHNHCTQFEITLPLIDPAQSSPRIPIDSR